MAKKKFASYDVQGSYKYTVHSIDLASVKLSESPLDDYQRLYFAAVMSQPLDQRQNLDIKRVTYKSNVAESFANPPCVSQDAVPLEANAGAPTAALLEQPSGKKPLGSHPKNVLDCFEYQFPDVYTGDVSTQSCHWASLSDSARQNLHLDDCPNQVLKGSISVSGKQPSDEVLSPLQSPKTNENDDLVANVNSLTKNQQFKLRKLDHNLQQNNKLLNPNNCVLWTHESGYVFLTGIWRLYQDVMRGLINIPRVDSEKFSETQEICKREFDYITTSAFYEPGASGPASASSASERKKRRQSSGPTSNLASNPFSGVTSQHSGGGALSFPISSTSQPCATSSISNYTDLHWNSLSTELKILMCESYKNHLISEKGLTSKELLKCDFAEVIRRIRGGYIKIQGTWLPLETARLLCVRFCYPIRYLLVPIFGTSFPVDCENWFEDVHTKAIEKLSQNALVSLDPLHQMPLQPLQQKRRKRRDSIKPKVNRPVGHELLNAFQNLLDISKHPPPMGLSPNQVRKRSSSCAPDCATFMQRRRSSSEKLPPISTIMESLSPRSSIVENDTGQRYVTTQAPSLNSENVSAYNDSPFMDQQPQLHAFPNPTVQTLSHLASFYNTHGHRYSYPGNIYMSHQRFVANRPSIVYNSHSGSFFENQPRGVDASLTNEEPLISTASNYKPVNTPVNNDYPRTPNQGTSGDPLTPNVVVSKGHKTDLINLPSRYPDMNAPMTYWFSTTR